MLVFNVNDINCVVEAVALFFLLLLLLKITVAVAAVTTIALDMDGVDIYLLMLLLCFLLVSAMFIGTVAIVNLLIVAVRVVHIAVGTYVDSCSSWCSSFKYFTLMQVLMFMLLLSLPVLSLPVLFLPVLSLLLHVLLLCVLLSSLLHVLFLLLHVLFFVIVVCVALVIVVCVVAVVVASVVFCQGCSVIFRLTINSDFFVLKSWLQPKRNLRPPKCGTTHQKKKNENFPGSKRQFLPPRSGFFYHRALYNRRNSLHYIIPPFRCFL